MNVVELINDFVPTLHKSDRAATALIWMDEFKVRHLPVVDHHNHTYLGLISEAELLSIEDDEKIISKIFNTLPGHCINQNDHFFNALNFMTTLNLTVLPVVDDDKKYLGLITGEGLLKQIAETMSVSNPGGIIILNINQNDYSLAEIVRIVEANDTKILSTSVKTIPNSANMIVTLKLNRINIEPVIQTFYRFQYDIRAYYGENEKDEELIRERYNSLMTYLNL